MESGTNSTWGVLKVLFHQEIGDPDQFFFGPNATYEPPTGNKGQLARIGLKLDNVQTWFMPGFHKVHHAGIGIHTPDLSNIPVQAFAKRLQDLWSGFAECSSRRQNMRDFVLGLPPMFRLLAVGNVLERARYPRGDAVSRSSQVNKGFHPTLVPIFGQVASFMTSILQLTFQHGPHGG